MKSDPFAVLDPRRRRALASLTREQREALDALLASRHRGVRKRSPAEFLGMAIGGVALSALLAFGGGAAAPVAVGGAALGGYAIGGAAAGRYVASAERADPEAVALLSRFGIMLPSAAPARAR